MSLKSMTGFARGSGVVSGWQWSWEVKSVNAKGLDSRVRVPAVLDGLDLDVKKLIAKHLFRGTIYANLEIKENAPEGESFGSLKISRDNLEELFDMLEEYESTSNLAPSSLAQLLAIKGIVEVEDTVPTHSQIQNIEEAVLKGFVTILLELIEVRLAEGQELEGVIEDNVANLENLVVKAVTLDAVRLSNIRSRFKEKVNALLEVDETLSAERFEQEVSLLAVKADVSEEINRLDIHLKSARKMLSTVGAVGRQYDFLAQEMSREVNTLCAKSSDMELTQLGLEMKSQVEMLREQIQNVE